VIRRWLRDVLDAWRNPFDIWPDSEPWDDSFPSMRDDEMDCPDTQPTHPGALDSLTGELTDDTERDH
jgi:hypothetical protein